MKKNTETLKTTVDLVSADATRDLIVAKIEGKASAAEKLETKQDNLDNQIEVYENSIVVNQDKIEKARARIEVFKESKIAAAEDVVRRKEELEHMEEILARYDLAMEERMIHMGIMQERLNSFPDWYPGMDESLKLGAAADPVYQEARKRKLYLDEVLESCLSDVRKISVSRGEVSGFNVKGREGV